MNLLWVLLSAKKLLSGFVLFLVCQKDQNAGIFTPNVVGCEITLILVLNKLLKVKITVKTFFGTHDTRYNNIFYSIVLNLFHSRSIK